MVKFTTLFAIIFNNDSFVCSAVAFIYAGSVDSSVQTGSHSFSSFAILLAIFLKPILVPVTQVIN